MVNKTANMEEYRRQYYATNREKIRDIANRGYINGELDSNSNVGRGFISEMVVARVLGLESDARCNCTANFCFKYDLLDLGGHGEINVKSSKLHERKRCGVWQWNFGLINKYKPDTYIFVAYTEDYKDIMHVWIVPVYENIVSDKQMLGISDSEKGLSRVRKFEVDNAMYNVYLHTMSINNCSVLKKQDFVEEMLGCL